MLELSHLLHAITATLAFIACVWTLAAATDLLPGNAALEPHATKYRRFTFVSRCTGILLLLLAFWPGDTTICAIFPRSEVSDNIP